MPPMNRLPERRCRLLARLMIVLAVGLFSTAAAANECHDYGTGPRVEGYPQTAYGGGRTVVDGDLAYVPSASYGFSVVDIADPESPALVAHYPELEGHFIAVRFPYAAMPTLDGLQLLNISNPENVRTVDTVETVDLGSVQDIRFGEEDLYVFTEDGRLLEFDGDTISSWLRLTREVAFQEGTGVRRGMAIRGNIAWLPVDDEFAIIDLETMDKIGRVESVGDGQVLFRENLAFVGGLQLSVYDITDAAKPAFLYAIPIESYWDRLIAATEDMVAVTDTREIQLWDIRSAPIVQNHSRIGLDENVTGLFVAHDHFYGWGHSYRPVLYGIDPNHVDVPRLGSLAVDGVGLAIENSLLGVADGVGGLALADVSDPRAPELLWESRDHIANGVDLVGSLAYAVRDDFTILDISDPRAPIILAKLESAFASAWSVLVSGEFAYVGDFSGLRVFNVEDPANPQEVDYIRTAAGRPITDLARVGELLLAMNSIDLHIFDISDPSHPQLLSETLFQWAGVGVLDRTTLVLGGETLNVVDISDPTAPVILGSTPIYGERSFDVEVDGNTVYVSTKSSIIVVDVTDPTAPRRVGRVHTGSGALAQVAFEDGIVYHVAPSAPLSVFPGHCSPVAEVDSATGPIGRSALRVFPNPTGDEAVWISAPTQLGGVTVFDVTGRAVRSFPSSQTQGEEWSLRWDLLDERGVEVPAGVYWAVGGGWVGDSSPARSIVVTR